MFPTLTTERFILQQIFPEDQQFIFEGLSHPDITRFYGVKYDSFESAKRQMDWYEKNLEENTGCSWKIVDKTSGEKIGVVAYYYFKQEHKKAEIGFWIFPQHWNKGIVTETIKAVIGYCRKEKGIHRLEAFVEEGNEASSRVLEKLGFICEGKMYECEIKDGRFINLFIFGLLTGPQ
jgi:ribosomal-protein-alanine N-acetyltransferase